MRHLFLFIFLIPRLCVGQNIDSINLANFVKEDPINGIVVVPPPQITDAVFKRAISEYNVFALKHRVRAYQWQLTSSKIIFSISVIIVLVGLFLSYLQFKSALTANRKTSVNTLQEKSDDSDSDIAKNGKSNLNSSLQVGADGIKIDSAVIGLIILLISVIFFFLYLKFVFHIKS